MNPDEYCTFCQHFPYVHSFLSLRCTRRTLLAGFCLCKRFVNAGIDFGVREFIDVLDFQAPIVIGNEVHDVHRLALRVQSVWVFRLQGRLWYV